MPHYRPALAVAFAIALAQSLTACATRQVPVAIDLPSPTPPPHLKQPPEKVPRLQGKAPLDTHLRQQAKQLRQLGDTNAKGEELQDYERDAAVAAKH